MTLFGDLSDLRATRGGLGAVLPNWRFGALVPAHYGLILADPPWRFENYSEAGEAKNPVAHYRCMDYESLAAMPVQALAARDAVLAMWAIWSLLPQAIDLLRAWGFAYKTGGHWHKLSKSGECQAFGPGYHYRAASEIWLIGTIGSPAILSHSIRNAIAAPVREHSRKPDQMHRDLEMLYAGPRCELFARSARPGWDVWGNETDKFETAR